MGTRRGSSLRFAPASSQQLLAVVEINLCVAANATILFQSVPILGALDEVRAREATEVEPQGILGRLFVCSPARPLARSCS